MPKVLAVALAAGVFVLSLIVLLLALNLLPSTTEAAERGTTAPLVITWLMALVTIACGVILGVFVLATGLGGRGATRAAVRVRS